MLYKALGFSWSNSIILYNGKSCWCLFNLIFIQRACSSFPKHLYSLLSFSLLSCFSEVSVVECGWGMRITGVCVFRFECKVSWAYTASSPHPHPQPSKAVLLQHAHFPSSLQLCQLIISQFLWVRSLPQGSWVGCSGPHSLKWRGQQGHSLMWGLGASLVLILVVERLHFLAVVRLRTPFSCWLLSVHCSQLLEAAPWSQPCVLLRERQAEDLSDF